MICIKCHQLILCLPAYTALYLIMPLYLRVYQLKRMFVIKRPAFIYDVSDTPK